MTELQAVEIIEVLRVILGVLLFWSILFGIKIVKR